MVPGLFSVPLGATSVDEGTISLCGSSATSPFISTRLSFKFSEFSSFASFLSSSFSCSPSSSLMTGRLLSLTEIAPPVFQWPPSPPSIIDVAPSVVISVGPRLIPLDTWSPFAPVSLASGGEPSPWSVEGGVSESSGLLSLDCGLKLWSGVMSGSCSLKSGDLCIIWENGLYDN